VSSVQDLEARIELPALGRSRSSRWLRIARFLLGRIAVGLVTLLLVSVIVFAATQALPGDAARAILGRNASPDRLALIRKELHLNRSRESQYVSWLSGVLHGNLGLSLTSISSDETVTSILGPRIKNSAILIGLAIFFIMPLSVLIGAFSAFKRDRLFDHITSGITLVLVALPDFAIALFLILLLSTSVFHVLPALSVIDPSTSIWAQWRELILPVLTLVIWETPYIARIMRASVIEVLESPYIEAARLKGVGNWGIVWRNALPNAIVPLIQVMAVQIAFLAGSIVVIEFVFDYPGIGQELVMAVTARDIPTIQAIALLIAGVYVVVNFLSDVATVLATPRLRTSFA
jgi:peptide/nickel transport system permease protein